MVLSNEHRLGPGAFLQRQRRFQRVGLEINNGNYEILFGGCELLPDCRARLSQCLDRCCACLTNGVARLFTNGIVAATLSATPIAPSEFFGLGASAGGGGYFNGSIDEVRISQFAPGAFSTSDLLLNESANNPVFTNLTVQVLQLQQRCVNRHGKANDQRWQRAGLV